MCLKMDYTKGNMGRVFVARLDHEEDLLSELNDLVRNEDIKSGFFFILGATGGALVVTGPKKKSVPPEINRSRFDDAKELLGMGSIFWESDAPKIHLHAAAGSNSGFVMGCFREYTEVFMVIEVVILEIEGITAERIPDKKMGFSPIHFFR